MRSSPSSSKDENIMEKTTKMKNWVKNRLLELERQNERLKEQNLRCTTQLQMLKSFSERTRQWRNEHDSMAAMSRSVTGTIMRSIDARTSDDSGLTSDDHCERRNEEAMTKSSMEMRRLSVSSTPRVNRKGVRLRGGREEDESTSDSSPFEEKAKPIPQPRMTRKPPSKTMERDSINSFADEYEFDCDDESFEDIDQPSTSRNAEYVNLADFCMVRDDVNIYADIVKSPVTTPPQLPEHGRMKLWEYHVHETAEKCLSLGEESPSPMLSDELDIPVVRRSRTSKNSLSSPLHPSTPEGSSVSLRISTNIEEMRNRADLRTSLVTTSNVGEKSGYWTQSGESRLRSLKRRFVVLRRGQLVFYKSHKTRDAEPLSTLLISEISTVTILNDKGGSYSFQIQTESGESTVYSTESERQTAEWVTTITQAIKGATLREMSTRSSIDSSISSFVTRVYCGHSKRFFAALVNNKLMFFRTSDYTVPSHFLSLTGAHISERQSSSSDELSSSSDDQLDERRPGKKRHEFAIAIHIANEDPTYVIVETMEEKEKWLYFLKAASGDTTLKGTPFEILLQRMLADGMPPGSALWNDLLLTKCEESPDEAMMSVVKGMEKKAIEMAKAMHLFVSVLMRPTGVQYHVDLAQNILQMAMQNEGIRNEFYAQVIRLTNGSMPFGLQGWKLLSLALPLFLPTHYALLWLLKRHLTRASQSSNTDFSGMALYCESALERAVKMGGRVEASSRMETHSILTRDPTTTKFPHSISVRLPNGDYQVVELDGSTEVGQCLSSLCLKLGMRPALLSGYALYIDDPLTKQLQLLKGKQKVCDSLSVWERRQRDAQRGRIPAESSARLHLRQRHYWRHLSSSETPIERRFLCARMGEEMREGRLPLSPQLADHLLSLYAQTTFGDFGTDMRDEQFEYVISRFYPKKMCEVTSDRILRSTLATNWRELSGSTEQECIRVILQVLRKWPLFGCHLYEAREKMNNGREVFIGLQDTCMHVLDRRELSILRSIPYSRLHSFGELQGDFMLTVERQLPPDAHPEETSKERVTYSMTKETLEELTLHLAEYIRCQKLVWKMST